jgi:hypothetical protein
MYDTINHIEDMNNRLHHIHGDISRDGMAINGQLCYLMSSFL